MVEGHVSRECRASSDALSGSAKHAWAIRRGREEGERGPSSAYATAPPGCRFVCDSTWPLQERTRQPRGDIPEVALEVLFVLCLALEAGLCLCACTYQGLHAVRYSPLSPLSPDTLAGSLLH